MRVSRVSRIDGVPAGDKEIEDLLESLVRAPMGWERDVDFRISVARAQGKGSVVLA